MLIIDFTDVARLANKYVFTSGIPRLVATLARQLQTIHKQKDEIAIGYFADVINSYVLVETNSPLNINDIKNKIGYAASSRTFRPERYKNKLGRYAFHCSKYYVKTCTHKLSLAMSGGLPPYLRKYKFQAGDHLLMLGSGWHADQLHRHLLDHYIDRNFDITVLVHDLTPIVFPDVTGTVLQEVFETWLHSVLRLKADILCYSQNTQRDVLRFCVSQSIPAPRTHVIPLVHELKRLEPGPIRDEVAQLAKQDYVLFVGPLSGRKNGLLLMQLWQRLANEQGSKNIPRLVFAGASCPQDVPESHRDALTSNITFINKPNDDELAALYRHAAFSVFLSMYEGWGLPVGESLWHGKTCLVADNSSLREVGGPFCEYVDLDDPEAAYAKLKQMVSNKSYVAALNSQIDRSKLRTWNDVARELSLFFNKRNATKPNGSILTLDTKNKKAENRSTYSNVAQV